MLGNLTWQRFWTKENYDNNKEFKIRIFPSKIYMCFLWSLVSKCFSFFCVCFYTTKTWFLLTVFDGSAHSPNEPSIMFLTPDHVCSLGSLIFSVDFALEKCSWEIVADVKQGFHHTEIANEHRDFLRFLWFKDILYNQETIILRFKRVIFGLTCTPFFLNGTIRELLRKYLPLRDHREIVLQLL